MDSINIQIDKSNVEQQKAFDLVANTNTCLFITGKAGTGKTTIAHIIANEFSEYIELNASDKRSHDLLMTTIGESANTYSLFGNNRKLIIMDEVDGIHGTNDRGGTKA